MDYRVKRLIITNGQSGVDAISQTGVEADLLSWDDVLHDGAVPDALDFRSLSRRRILELASFFGNEDEIRLKFDHRDTILETASQREEVLCWFEHDLYDQLQLWQVLDLLLPFHERVSIICENQYITSHSSEELRQLFNTRKVADKVHLEDASQLWTAFRRSSPTHLQELKGATSLRFANETIDRWSGCFPSKTDGLNTVERHTLELLLDESHPMPFVQLFKGVANKEQAQFMGDASFELVLNRLRLLAEPLIEFRSPSAGIFPDVAITAAGRSRLQGQSWTWDVNYQYWVGGVHLSPSNPWTFDPFSDCFIRLSDSK